MANLPENTTNPILRPVTQLEITTKVYGGEYIPDDEQQRGISNLQAIELAERDQYIISRVGQPYVPESGDIPAEVGIASLDENGKLPKAQNTTNVVFTDDAQTLTNKTISFADNTLTGVASTSTAQTLTNKTIDVKDNTILCTATNITSSQTITPTKQMMVTAGMSGITITLGSGPYAGYALPILAVADCYVAYTSIDGAATETLDVGSYITFIWDATGSYWVVDAGAFEKPTYISTSQTLTPVKKMIAVIDTASVFLTVGAGPYDGFELPILARAASTIIYTGKNGSVTVNAQADSYYVLVWDSSSSGFWMPRETVPITGIDDNGQPFAFNIDTIAQADGILNLTISGKDGVTNDYGLGKLVTAADDDTYSTSEQLTTKTWIDGKPIYRKVIQVPTFTIPASTSQATTTQYVGITGTGNLSDLITVRGWATFTYGTAQTTWKGNIPYVNPFYSSTSQQIRGNTFFASTITGSGLNLEGKFAEATTISNCIIIAEYTKTTD